MILVILSIYILFIGINNRQIHAPVEVAEEFVHSVKEIWIVFVFCGAAVVPNKIVSQGCSDCPLTGLEEFLSKKR